MTIRLSRISTCLILAGSLTPLRADGSASLEQMKAFYSTLSNLITGTSEIKPAADTMLVLANPAISITKWSATSGDGSSSDGDGSSPDDTVLNGLLANAYIHADSLFEAKPQYTTINGATLSGSIYETILNHHAFTNGQNTGLTFKDSDYINAKVLITGSYPKLAGGEELTPDMVAAFNTQIDAYNQKHANPADRLQKIVILNEELAESNRASFKNFIDMNTKINRVNNDLAMAMKGTNGSLKSKLQSKLRNLNMASAAYNDDWQAIQAALGIIKDRNSDLPQLWFEQMIEQNARYMPSDGIPGKPATFLPDVTTWNTGDDDDDGGWTQFSYSTSDFENHTRSSSSSTSASASLSWGPFSADASASMTHQDASELTKKQKFSLSMQIKRVDIFRPWLDPNLWGSWGWRHSENSPLFNKSISWGTVLKNTGTIPGFPRPVAPLYATAFILAKGINLTVFFDESSDITSSSSFSSHASASYGPFSFSASHEEAQSSEDKAKHQKRLSFSSKGVTLVGFVGQALPVTPGKRPSTTPGNR